MKTLFDPEDFAGYVHPAKRDPATAYKSMFVQLGDKLNEPNIGLEIMANDDDGFPTMTWDKILELAHGISRNFDNSGQVFLCHSHIDVDQKVIEQICRVLREHCCDLYSDDDAPEVIARMRSAGFTGELPSFVDEHLQYGEDNEIKEHIRQKIEDCKRFIAIVTVNWLQSKWCNWELHEALRVKEKKDILLILIRPCIRPNTNMVVNEYVRNQIEMDAMPWMGYMDSQIYPYLRNAFGCEIPPNYYQECFESEQIKIGALPNFYACLAGAEKNQALELFVDAPGADQYIPLAEWLGPGEPEGWNNTPN